MKHRSKRREKVNKLGTALRENKKRKQGYNYYVHTL